MCSCLAPSGVVFFFFGGGGEDGSVGSLVSGGLLTNVREMGGFMAVAAGFCGRWAQVTRVLLFAIPEKNRICFQV